MDRISRTKTNIAVRECHARCLRAKDSLTTLTECLSELKTSGDWEEVDVRKVEWAVRTMLTKRIRASLHAKVA